MRGIRRRSAARDGVAHFMERRAFHQRLLIFTPDQLGKFFGLFVRVAVLLETFDTVLHFRTTEAGQKEAGLNNTDMHDSRVQFLADRQVRKKK